MRVSSSKPAARRASGPAVSCGRGPMRCASVPDGADSRSISSGGRQHRDAGLRSRPTAADLQLVHDEEEGHADRGVEQHGHDVHDRERAVAEQRWRHERAGVWRMRCTNAREARRIATANASDAPKGCAPAVRPRFGERPRARGQAAAASTCAGDVEARAPCGSRDLRHRDACAQPIAIAATGTFEQERPPPSRTADERAAHERTDRARRAAEPRPRADGRGAVAAAEARLDDREAARCEQRAADALQDACGDEHLDVRRGTATSDATANHVVPIMKTLRRPIRSPSAPPRRISDASASR